MYVNEHKAKTRELGLAPWTLRGFCSTFSAEKIPRDRKSKLEKLQGRVIGLEGPTDMVPLSFSLKWDTKALSATRD